MSSMSVSFKPSVDSMLAIMGKDSFAPTLPPGHTTESFEIALKDLISILGLENVSKDKACGLENYYDPWSMSNAQNFAPSAACRPQSIEQVQAILKVADKHSLPLWTISRGKNFGYGGSAPVVKGSVVLDLHLMKKIIEVNEEYAYAIVEPGVTFFDLYQYIQAHSLKLWISCPALGWGSIVGNCLERGFGYTPTGEHSQQQCGMEIVLPSGQLLRTGMGAMASSDEPNKTWPLYKGGYGPSVDGMFYQSNLGIVTKMGIWLFPQPQSYISCSISVPEEDDLVNLVGTLSDLQRRNIIQNSPSVCNLFRQAITSVMDPVVMEKLGPYMRSQTAFPPHVLEDLRSLKGWGWWSAQFAVYGPESLVRSSWEVIQAAFRRIPGSNCEGKIVTGINGQPVMTTDLPHEDIPHAGVPHLTNLGLMEYRGQSGGHTCFSPILPPSGRELYAWYLTAKQRTIDANFDFFADFHVFPRYVIAIELVVFAEDEADRCDRLYRLLADDAVKQGYSEYRTHVAYMDLIASHYDANDSALRRYVDAIKDMTDPKGILSLGKQGIWGSSELAREIKKSL